MGAEKVAAHGPLTVFRLRAPRQFGRRALAPKPPDLIAWGLRWQWGGRPALVGAGRKNQGRLLHYTYRASAWRRRSGRWSGVALSRSNTQMVGLPRSSSKRKTIQNRVILMAEREHPADLTPVV